MLRRTAEPAAAPQPRSTHAQPANHRSALAAKLLFHLFALTVIAVGAAQAQNLVLVPTIRTIAGVGSAGYAGDGGQATSAQLNNPLSDVVDTAGNVYFSDYFNNRVRRIDAITGVITTIAGTGTAGFSGDGGLAVNAELNAPGGIAFDSVGNLYIGDSSNNRVRVVNLTTGIITTYAGSSSTPGYSGDGGPATSATFNYTDGIGFDSAGNLYIADRSNYRIRKVAVGTKIVTTVVGTGTQGYSGDGAAATSARIGSPWSAVIDNHNNLYFVDSNNARVRKVVLPNGNITTVAGNGTAGYSGDGGQATAAELNFAVGSSLDVDTAGNLYITDQTNCRIREVIAATGVIQTIAGSAACGYAGDNGPAIAAELQGPQRIQYGSKTGVFIAADTSNNVLRRFSNGTVLFPATAVGSSSASQTVYLQTTAAVTIKSITIPQSMDGKQEFTVGTISGCTVDGATVVPSKTNCIIPITFTPGFPGQRSASLTAVTSTGTASFSLSGLATGSQVALVSGPISTIAGTGVIGYTGNGGAATSATMNAPRRSFVDAKGNVYIADDGNNVVRKLTASTGLMSTVAGNGVLCANTTAACGDGGAATSANLNAPTDIAVDSSGNIYIADELDNRVRLVKASTGLISTIAGNGTAGYTGDTNAATAAELNQPTALALDQYNNLYIVDSGNNVIREIDATTGVISTLAGNGTACAAPTSTCGDGGPATSANFSDVTGIAVDEKRNLYIADTADNRIRFVNSMTGMISTIAGTGAASYTGDGNAASAGTLNGPREVALDSAHNLYIADAGNNVIRLVTSASGIISTYAGVSTNGCTTPTAACGDGGPATSASLSNPRGVAVDSDANVYITDTDSNRIRKINAQAASFAFASTVLGATSTDSPQTLALLSTGNTTLNFPVPASGNDPVISNSFDIESGSTCPQLSGTSSTAGTLAPGLTCKYLLSFSPVAVGSISGSLIITDDALNAASPSYTKQTITLSGTGLKATTPGTLTSSNQSPQFGQSVTLTDTFPTLGTQIPSGTVTFYSGTTSLGTGTINALGVASLTTTQLAIGIDPVTASYPGDSNFSNATSNTVTETVSRAASSGTLTSSSMNPTVGQSVTLTETLSSANSVTPTGTVTFYNGTTSLGTGPVNASGIATLTTTTLPVGTDSVTASYGGDTTYSNSTSNAVLETVTKNAGANTLTTSNANPAFGTSITLTDTLAAVNGITPTGTVTFSNGTTVLGTGTVNGSGVATLSTSTLPIGSDSITASYAGDGSNSASTSSAITETVTKATNTGTLTTSNANPNFGQSVTLTDVLSAVNGVIPTGTVTFYSGTISLGTGSVTNNGIATLATTALPAGTDTVTAVYGGDTSYNTSTSNAVTENVAKGSSTGTLTSTNTAPAFGTSVTLTDTLTSINSVIPTGTVTFYNGGTSLGTGTVSNSGVATLATTALPVGTDSVTAAYSGDTTYNNNTSNAVSEAVSKATGTNVLSLSNPAPTFGQSVTLTDTLSLANGVAPTGTVTFYNGTTVLGTGTVNASGVATLATAVLPVGTDSLTAVYGGDGDFNTTTSSPVSATVAKGVANGTLTTNNPTPNYGQSVTLTDTLAAINGTVPTGAVTFYNGTTSIGTGTVNSSGVASLPIATLPVGTDSITAVYGGDGNYSTSTSNATTETVGKNGGTATLTTSNASPSYGSSVTLTDTLSSVNGTAPTGTVTFYSGSTSLGTGTVSGSGLATLATSALPVGTDSVTAVYGGDTNYSTSTSNAISETVAKTTPANALSTSNAAPTYGQSITLTSTLQPSNGVYPTGTVIFYNGTAAIGTGSVSTTGVATLGIATLPVGTDSITATYGGDANFSTSTSAAVTETVTKTTGTAALTSSNAAPIYGGSITLTDTLSSVSGAAPTGTVTFYNGATSLGTGTVNGSGVATLATAALPVGTDTVNAVYGGDSNYASSTSNNLTETVAKGTSTGTLTTSNASPSAGQSVTLTDTLPSSNGTVPTGTVTFYSGSASLGTATPNASGVATLATSSLPVGTDSVTAVYGGDTNFGTSTSNAVTETVTKSSAGGALTASNTSPSYGQPITLTDTLTTANGIVPTGTVTFYNGSTAIGTGSVSATGVATLSTGSLPVGTASITAVYGGDSNYGTSTSNATAVNVGKNAGTGTLSTSNAAPTYGQFVTFTDTLPSANSVVPTGTVTFYNGSTALGTGSVSASGVATLATSALPVGTDTVTAVYGGDANYSSTTSNAIAETVAKNGNAGTLTTSNAAPGAGQAVTLTDTLPIVNSIAPTGTVTFYSGSTAIGTGTVNASGVATLATGSLPVGTDAITAVYGGDTNYSSDTSNAVTETVAKDTSTGTLSTSNAAPTYGQSVTLTDTLAAVNGLTPTGSVTFSNGTGVIGTGTLNSSGVATLSTGSLPVGADSITAAYGGDANFASTTSNAIVENVSKSSGAGTLTTSNAAPTYGTSVTLTDTLPIVNGVAPTGTVTFSNGSASLGTGSVNASGTATLVTSALPVGTDAVTAVYGGDTNYGTDTSNTVTETVAKNGGTGTLITSNAAPSYGQSITLTDTLPTVNSVTPTGTVTFYSSTSMVGTGTVSASGVATLATGSLPVGTDSITALYGGDSNYSSTTSNAVTETVSRSAGTDALTASSTSPTYGQSDTLTDTLPTVNGVVPTGTVTFYNGTAVLGTGSVNGSGVATFTTGSLPVGTDSITAMYGGDSSYAQANAGPLSVAVAKAAGTGTLTTSNAAPNSGQSVTLTDTITPVNGIAPTGGVTFYNGTASLGTGTVNSSGVAMLSTSSLPVGNDSVTAVYAGDTNYSTSTSNAVAENVTKNTGSGSLITSNADPSFGQSVTFTNTLPTVNGVVPTGTVTFSNGTTVLGMSNVNGSGVATLSTSVLPVGADSVTAAYSGDSNYSAVTSNAVAETVTKNTGTGTLTSSNASPTAGQSVTLTDTLPSVNGIEPTGTVTFYNGSTAVGSGTVGSTGVATLTNGSLPVGTDSITAVYGGDTNYASTTSNAVAETVSKNSGAGTLTVSNTAPTSGASVTLTDTLPTTNGVVPTGTVTFYAGSSALGTGTVNTSGVASLATGSLPVGTDSVTAVYGGDSSNGTNTSNAVTVTISKSTGAGTLTTSNTAPNYGQSITLTDTLPIVNGIVPTGTVTFSSGSASLGTGMVNASGVATLATGTLPVGTDSVTAAYSGDPNYGTNTSNAITETVAKTSQAGTLTTSNASPTAGQSVSLTDTLPAVNGVVPTGMVTFYAGGSSLGTGNVNASGIATLATSSLPVGTDSVTAVYSGDTNFSSGTSNAVTETVAKGSAAGTLTASTTTPTFGQNVTLTDTLPLGNNFAPTGTVTFYSGTAILGTGSLNSSGVATLTTGSLPAGTDSVTAVYDGDTNFSAGTSNALSIAVAKDTGADTLTTSNPAPSYGQAITFTDTLPAVNGVVPTGTVTFSSGSTSLGTSTVNASGVATLTTGALPVGTDSVIANYGGDTNYAASASNAVTETIAKTSGTGTLTSSNAAPGAGQSITLTDTLPTANGVVPTGTVTFFNGTASIGTGTVNASGIATLATGALPVGSDSITAVYGGDTNYNSGTSNALTVAVGKNPGTATLITSNSAPNANQAVTFTATVSTVNGIVPTGTVTFSSGSTSLGTGTLNSTGVATLTTSALPVGTDVVIATYGGDTSYATATSNTVTETVARNAGTGTLTSSNIAPAAGQSITLTDTLPTVNGVVPTGTVTFFNGATTIGTGTVNASGVATFTLGSLPVGADNLTAVYGGDSTYGTSTAGPLTVTVGKASGAGTLTTSNAAPVANTNVTFTDTLALVNGIAPTGTVTFSSGNTVLGTGTINASGVATLTTGSLPVGTDTVTAVYAGDSNYAAGTSNAVSENVSKSNGSATLTSSTTTPSFGQSVTLTDTLPTVNGVVPTGTVNFFNGTTGLGTGTLNASGIATLTTSTLPVGSDSVTAVSSGDATYASATSNAVSETVSKNTGAATLTSTNTAPNYGQAVTLTDTLSSVNGVVPTGTVTFSNGTTVLGTGVLNSSGVATLTTGSLPVGTDSVTASFPGDSNYSASTSNAITETVARSSGNGTLTTSNAAPTAGQSVTFTDTLPDTSNVVPTGTVTFYNGATVLGTGTVSSLGVATLSTTALPTGTDSVTAVYGGDKTYSSSTSNAVGESVAKNTVAGTLTSSTATPTAGQSITLTDTIPPANGLAPTGTVTFFSNGTLIGTGTVNSSGIATLTTALLPAGTDGISAVYGGDSNYESTSPTPITVTVGKGTGSSTLTTSNAAPALGQAVTLTDTVPVVNGVAPTGTVTFYNGNAMLGTGTLNGSGVATLTTSALPAGTDSVAAAYSGDTNYSSSLSNTVVETVAKSGGSGSLTSSNATPTYGQSVTFTETLPAVNGVYPTGTVTFYNGTTVLGTATLNASGVATLVTSALPVGTQLVTAAYGGDTNFSARTSNALSEAIAKADGTGVLSTSDASPNYGQTVTLTDTLTLVNEKAPTGTVTFSNGSTALGTGTVNSSGIATLSTASLPAGTDPVTATYSGDATYNAGSSNTVTETVTKGASAGTLATSNPDPSFGQPVTFTDTLPTVNSIVPTGTVTFSSGSTVLGAGTVGATGVATLTTGVLPVGTESVTAVYGGDTNYTAATSNAVSETVTRNSGTGTLTSSNPSPTAGQPVLLSDTLSSVNGVIPTGTVTFYNGATAIGTGTVNSAGVATLTTTTLPVGAGSITAVYGGDSNYNSNTSAGVSENVSQSSGTGVLTTSNPAPTAGQAITLTDTLSAANGAVPTGTVTFTNGTAVLGTGTVNSAGVATLTTSALPAGTATITAVYGGDKSNSTNTSNPVTEIVAASTAPTLPTSPTSPTAPTSPTTPTTPTAPVATMGTLTTSNASVMVSQPVTFTETLTTVNGIVPTGTVTFYSGTTAIGNGKVNASGVATLTTSTLSVGSDVITAAYSGDTNYGAFTDGPLKQTITPAPADFSIGATPANQTVDPGDTTSYTINLAGLNTAFNASVVLSATGLPPGATVSFSPATLVPGTGPTGTTMTIVTSPLQARATPSNGFANISYGLFLLPLLGVGRVRRKLRALPRNVAYCLVALALLGSVGAMTGCGGGFFGAPPHSYTITVTGTSGSLSHATTVTLTVE